MHVLVATDGTLDTDAAAKFAVALAGPKGKATVATIVKVPRTLVQELRHQWSDPATIHVDMDGEYVASTCSSRSKYCPRVGGWKKKTLQR